MNLSFSQFILIVILVFFLFGDFSKILKNIKTGFDILKKNISNK